MPVGPEAEQREIQAAGRRDGRLVARAGGGEIGRLPIGRVRAVGRQIDMLVERLVNRPPEAAGVIGGSPTYSSRLKAVARAKESPSSRCWRTNSA